VAQRINATGGQVTDAQLKAALRRVRASLAVQES
jgi:hypothetical protein